MNTQHSMRGIQELLSAMHGTPKGSPNVLMRAPVSSQPEAMSAPMMKQTKLTQHQLNMRKLVGRVKETVEELESAGFTRQDVISLACMYRDLVPGDEVCPISIKMMKDFLENVIRCNSEADYNKLLAYYNVTSEEQLSDKKAKRLRNDVYSIWDGYRTIENAYRYSYGFKDVADEMAKKLDAPAEMSVIERVKWIRVWVVILCDQMLFWGDLDNNGKIKSKETTARFNEKYVYPESMIFVWFGHLKNMPDGYIVYDMMRKLIEVFPEKAQNAVMRYGEFFENKPDSTKVEHIRNSIKKLLFPRPWLAQSSHFCTKMGVELFIPDRLENAVMAWKNGGIETMSTFELPYYDVYNGLKHRTLTCYKYGTGRLDGQEMNAGVSCKEELEMYVALYQWYLAHPDFKFGPEKKTLQEYGMAELLVEKVDIRTCVSAWIIDMGLAREESDINWELAEEILGFDEKSESFEEFYKGNLSEDDIYETYQFASMEQAIACFSLTRKISEEEIRKMGAALKRVKMFGIERALPGDCIYLALFRFLIKNKPEVVGKNLIQLYAAKLCP